MARSRRTATPPPPPPQAEVGWEPAAGCRFSQAEIAVIGPALLDMHNRGIRLTGPNIVREASDEDSPLHPFLFKIRVAKMVKEWRLRRAGDMARAVIIRTHFRDTEGRTREHKVRAFVHVKTTIDPYGRQPDDQVHPVENGEYVPFPVVVATPEYLNQVIAEARADMIQLSNRYNYYRQFLPNFSTRFRAEWAAILELMPGQDNDDEDEES